jgi:hypothetical protein
MTLVEGGGNVALFKGLYPFIREENPRSPLDNCFLHLIGQNQVIWSSVAPGRGTG